MTERTRPAWLDRWLVVAVVCLVASTLTLVVWVSYLGLGVAAGGKDFDPPTVLLVVARTIGNGTFVVGLFCLAVWSVRRLRGGRPPRRDR